MASSSRSKKKTKKVGLSRMDAALDHLVPLGFKKQKINNTIKSLLKEYGGDEGWYFLEENNYLLVIDTIINDQNAIEDEQPLPLLPAPPSPRCLPLQVPILIVWMQEEEEQLQNRVSSDEEIKMEVQRKCNGGGSGEVTTMKPAEIEFMDEKLLHIIPPGRCRPPLYGYLSETDSDFDAELDDDGHLPSP
ncbi:Nucleolar histone methyltransferase-related protein [Rhynchospora pubera]|uniref:Nucleolar histone methyltransferase-related protein n=1 Tax=Rhynchospora pubera TaxID=906938 RepID=A0AAV8DMK4_9POAL|nr:Nucleolar histone methyltransferase-related protein [Rhynchospora pubera]